MRLEFVRTHQRTRHFDPSGRPPIQVSCAYRTPPPQQQRGYPQSELLTRKVGIPHRKSGQTASVRVLNTPNQVSAATFPGQSRD